MHNQAMRSCLASALSGKLEVWHGDITEDDCAAIVNAANPQLGGGGGVDGAIHLAGGPQILQECLKIRETQYPKGLPPGEAVATSAGRLKAAYVIHTVGPRWGREQGKEPHLLSSSYRNSFKIANELGITSIAFPAISTGIYGFPKTIASQLAAGVIEEWLHTNPNFQLVRLYFWSLPDAELFCRHSGLEMEMIEGKDQKLG